MIYTYEEIKDIHNDLVENLNLYSLLTGLHLVDTVINYSLLNITSERYSNLLTSLLECLFELILEMTQLIDSLQLDIGYDCPDFKLYIYYFFQTFQRILTMTTSTKGLERHRNTLEVCVDTFAKRLIKLDKSNRLSNLDKLRIELVMIKFDDSISVKSYECSIMGINDVFGEITKTEKNVKSIVISSLENK